MYSNATINKFEQMSNFTRAFLIKLLVKIKKKTNVTHTNHVYLQFVYKYMTIRIIEYFKEIITTLCD